jgi:hypothetical protein
MIGRDAMIAFARDALGLPASTSVELSPLSGRGSDRSYFRLKWNEGGSAILVHYDPKRTENNYFADIAVFLGEIRVPVPRLIRHDPAACLTIMEDIGETDLWSLRETPRESWLGLYRKTILIVDRLHSIPEKEFPSGRVKLMEGFGPALYRWERDYFREHFVRGFCAIGIEPRFERELESELAALAKRLQSGARCLLHRDLQSQNVMVRDGEPFLIDFQGMRFGSPFYDLGSFLCDPYVHLSDEERAALLSFYYRLSERRLDWAVFQRYFWEASAQRLMQALGAYGFLGIGKGLSAYLEHIPAALTNLRNAASHVDSLPRLGELIRVCRKAIERDAPRDGGTR